LGIAFDHPPNPANPVRAAWLNLSLWLDEDACEKSPPHFYVSRFIRNADDLWVNGTDPSIEVIAAADISIHNLNIPVGCKRSLFNQPQSLNNLTMPLQAIAAFCLIAVGKSSESAKLSPKQVISHSTIP